jgi:ferredoxin-NADP reductase
VDDGLTPKLRWRVGRVVDSTPETESARTIALAVPRWGGHLAGQHIDLKLTAEDGYSAQRSYSLSRPPDGQHIEPTVQQITDGEVSPYHWQYALAKRSNFAALSATGLFGGRPRRPGFCWSLADRTSFR